MSMLPDELPFRGIVFFEGVEHLPDDVVLSLDEIRKWAMNSGFVSDPEFQLLQGDRAADVAKVTTPGDELSVAIAITNLNSKTEYFEYPFLPVRSLIRRGTGISLVYWKVMPTQSAVSGNAPVFGEVRFGFWLTGSHDEFCSVSTATRVVPKFVTRMEKLALEFPVNVESQGAREITVDGAVLATFIKEGRSFDVLLSRK